MRRAGPLPTDVPMTPRPRLVPRPLALGRYLLASSSDPDLTPRLTNTVCGRQRHGGPAHVGNAAAL
jgi:hypothetical protein